MTKPNVVMDLKQKIEDFFDEFLKNKEESSEIKNLRNSAFSIFKKEGFPTKKLETWKYTSLNSVLKDDYSLNSSSAEIKKTDIQDFLLKGDSYQLVFVNGKFEDSLSKTDDKLNVIPISDLLLDEKYRASLNKYYNQIASNQDSLTALNTALSQNGVFIHLKKGKVMEKPVQILYISSGLKSSSLTFSRNLIIAEENSEIKIVERHQNISDYKVFTNSVTEIFTEANAFVDYYKIQNDSSKSILIDNTYAHQNEKSHTSVHTFSFGGDITRNNLHFYQNGEFTESTLKGITILNDRQHVDHSTLVNHIEPNCESHQNYKSILSERSSSAFNGRIIVQKEAQKTNAYQQNDNILLSDKATIYTKPQLEIFADDVKCSHGCTIGQLDKKAIFYLQSRGIPRKEAEALLTYAFAYKVLSSVKISEVKALVKEIIAQKLGVKQIDFTT